MIAYFPSVYQDELLYSWLARFYVGSGYISYSICAEDLFANKKGKPNIEFVNRLTQEAKEKITMYMSMEDVILKHTMFPYYGRFLQPELKRKDLKDLISMKEQVHISSIPSQNMNKQARYLRYCPVCAKTDKEVFGETYWHRLHQLFNVDICPIHYCKLVVSGIPVSWKTREYFFYTADEYTSDPPDIQISENDLERSFAKYAMEIFLEDMDIESDVPIGTFLRLKAKSAGYLNGQMIKAESIFNDLKKYYQRMPNNSIKNKQQILEMFKSRMTKTHDILLLAYFLNVPVYDLTHLKLPP